MPQAARTYTDYPSSLLLCLEEECAGEAFFAALAERHDGRARHALLLMAQIERAMTEALRPLVERHRLTPSPLAVLHAEGAREARALQTIGWRDFLERMARDYPAYLGEFEAIAGLGPAEDQEVFQLMLDHEVAFIDFALRDLAGDPDSHRALESFLGRAIERATATAGASVPT
jgi:hypothetical protein